jgi:hypothetical protein
VIRLAVTGTAVPASLEFATRHHTSDCIVASVMWFNLVQPVGAVGVTSVRFADTKSRRASPTRTAEGTVTTSLFVLFVADAPPRYESVAVESDTDTDREAKLLAPSSSVTVTLTG